MYCKLTSYSFSGLPDTGLYIIFTKSFRYNMTNSCFTSAGTVWASIWPSGDSFSRWLIRTSGSLSGKQLTTIKTDLVASPIQNFKLQNFKFSTSVWKILRILLCHHYRVVIKEITSVLSSKFWVLHLPLTYMGSMILKTALCSSSFYCK